MAFVLNDRVKETTTSTGTGTVNLAGAATGFETFVAGVGNSNVTYYCIAHQTAAEFEVGIGTVTDASPDTLSRTTILSSTNSDSAVDFSAGTKDVFCTLPASKTIREFDTALNVPTGTTAQRASSPVAGDLRFNTTSSKFEGYSGSAWGNVGEGNFLVTNIFAGDGSDTTFTISNAVSGEQQLMVFIDGVFQAHDTYTVSGTTVTFSTAPANGRVITIYSALNNVQGSNMVLASMTGDNSDTTLALGVTPTSENAVQVYIDGTYQNKDTYSISGQTLTFSTAPPTGVAVEAITHTITDISAAASNILVDEFTGDGSDTTFTLSAAPTNENNTQVFVGGVYQEKATYSISNAVLTFSTAPANGVSIEVVSIAVGQINSAVQLSDADGDTKVMVEESSDEDTIRMDIAGTEVLTLTNSAMTLKGTTPTLTIGDAGAEDTKIVFDGNAQDYYIGLDDSADDLVIGKGSAVGTTPAISVDENQKVTFTKDIEVQADSVSGSEGGHITLRAASGGSKEFGIDVDSSNNLRIITEDDGTGDNGAAHVYVTNTGNVGIGQSSPNDETNRVSLELNDTWGGVFQNSVSGTPKSEWRWNTSGATIFGSVANEPLAFYTNNTERMRIGANGQLSVGVAVSGEKFYVYGNDASQYLGLFYHDGNDQNRYGIRIVAGKDDASDVIYHVRCDDGDGHPVGYLLHENGTLQINQGSDERLKENIVDSTLEGINTLKNIRQREFNFKRDTSKTKVTGYVAQEMESVYPAAVGVMDATQDGSAPEDDLENPYKTLSKTALIDVLIKATQEQQVIIEDLKARITTLEGS
jgi:hypothetical protein